MIIRRAIFTIVGLGSLLLAAQAQASDIKVLSSTAVKAVLEELGAQFEAATENKLVFTFAPAAVLRDRIEKGEAFDVAILTDAAITDLAAQNKIATGTTTAVAHAGLGVAIRKGAPKPDIGTTAAFRQTLLDAKSIGYTAQGASGVYLKVLFDKLGIAEALKPKIKLLEDGAGAAAAKGEVEIGITQISEILPYADAELVGPLPDDIQSYTNFVAGLSATSAAAGAGKSLLMFLDAPAAAPVIKSKGMVPG